MRQVSRVPQGSRRNRPDPATWVRTHGDALFRYAMLRLCDRDAAEEVVQECFVAALHAQERFASDSSERTWLVGILKHKIMDHFRRGRGVAVALSRESDSDFFDRRGHWKFAPKRWREDPLAAIQRREFGRVLLGCLQKLPAGVGDAFVLREMDRVDADQICELLNITQANLWQRLHRARIVLRRCLELHWFCPPKGTGK